MCIGFSQKNRHALKKARKLCHVFADLMDYFAIKANINLWKTILPIGTPILISIFPKLFSDERNIKELKNAFCNDNIQSNALWRVWNIPDLW